MRRSPLIPSCMVLHQSLQFQPLHLQLRINNYELITEQTMFYIDSWVGGCTSSSKVVGLRPMWVNILPRQNSICVNDENKQ